MLKGMSITINQGDTLAIIGASGAGKSTLLNIMGALELPSSGNVKINGRDTVDLDESALCRMRNREIGFVFQFHHLLPEFNAIENTLMPALISRMGQKEAMEMAGNMLDKVGLGNRLNHRVGELSGGEQQRVAIARALVTDPPLLLADEPTGNLDSARSDELMGLICELNRTRGITIAMVTHEPDIAAYAQRTIVFRDGRIVEGHSP